MEQTRFKESDTMTAAIRFTSLMLVLMTSLFAAGCNTARGLGEDVEATGEAVRNAAQNTEDWMEQR